MTKPSVQPPRKVAPRKAAGLDEPLWPVNVAIIVLAGFLVGVVCSQASFDPAEAAFFENAYLHLGILALMIGTLVWAVTWLQGRIARRVQLCVLFSVLVHLGLAVYLQRHYLQFVLIEHSARDLEEFEPAERITVPDYPWHHPDEDRALESFERPVETETADSPELEPVERRPIDDEATVERPSELEPERKGPEEPDPAELRRAELARAERPENPEPIPRQRPKDRPEPHERVDLPELPPTVEPPPPIELQPGPVLAERRQQVPEAARRAVEPTPSEPDLLPPDLARRADPSEGQMPELELPSDEPITLARAEAGTELPSTTTRAEDVTAPAAAGAAAPSRLEPESQAAAVQRSDDGALRRPNTAAAGAAEFATGSSEIVARVGQPRAGGRGAPSAEPSDSSPRIARAAMAPALPTSPAARLADVPALAEARGGGGPSSAPPDAQATPVGRAGGVGIPSRARTSFAGSGPTESPGAAATIPAAQLARVTGEPSMAPIQAGGGRPMPARKFGRGFASGATVEVPEIAPGPRDGGAASGPRLDAQPSGQTHQVAGLPGNLPARPRAGAIPSLAERGPELREAVARRATAGQQEPGRVGTQPANAATLVKSSTGPALPAAAVPLDDVTLPGAGGSQIAQGAAPSSLPSDEDGAQLRPLAPGAADVSAVAPTAAMAERGAAGRAQGVFPATGPNARSADEPGSGLAPRVGAPARRGGSEDGIPLADVRRPALRRSGGLNVPGGPLRRAPTVAFEQREPERRAELAEKYGATEASEKAVELGLDFLAKCQFPDGHWSLNRLPGGGQPGYVAGQMHADTAATGLALLAFLGAGYTHVDNKHREVVERGIDWLVANQQPDGSLFTPATDGDRPARSYGHAIASIALCEACGMTGDRSLRGPADRAIRWILAAQHPERGGWRYTKPEDSPGWHKESDTSVSGWMLMALKSARMAGLEVPPEAMERVDYWLNSAQADRGARYMYNPYAANTADQRQGRIPNLAMTAEGLLMRLYLGWDRTRTPMVRGADVLRQNLPRVGGRDRPSRDAYYWYYATQVMFQMQGEHWESWNERLRPMLVDGQIPQGPLAGSWDPEVPLPDRWSHAGGQLYVTTLNLLMLEVYYRYLPLFKTLVEDS